MNILITGHHSLGNRGCEALLRSTVAMIRTRFPSARFWVPSSEPTADAAQWPEHAANGVTFIEVPRSGRFLRAWARTCGMAPFMAGAPWPTIEPPASWHRMMDAVDLTLSIGGDNYTLDYGLESLAYHVGLSNWSMKHGKPVILWGASVGPFGDSTAHGRWVRTPMSHHLARLGGISLRESLTAQHLDELMTLGAGDGIHPLPPRRLLADPAFNLVADAAELGPHWPSGKAPVLGLNISPLVLSAGQALSKRNGDDGAIKLADLAEFIRQRCESGEYRIVLIPHVSARDPDGRAVHAIAPRSDDDVLLDHLMERLEGVKGLGRIPTWDAPRLKYAISRCDLFIGSRTHSVIAALSSGVPAVALAYSVKARGIHRDLFGHEEGVVDMGELSTVRLNHALDQLAQRSAEEKTRLLTLIPHWREKALQATDLLTA